MLTQERLKELLHYDSDTGIFTWKVSLNRRIRAGSVAGTVAGLGYIQVGVNGRLHLAHRLAWLYSYGEFPHACLDHINQARADNRICNLRPATPPENQKNRSMQANNTSGYKGVCWDNRAGKWKARARMNGVRHSLGCYATAELASAAYEAFAKQNHREFYRCTTGGQT